MLAVVGKFPNRTGVMEQILKAELPLFNWAEYCAMAPVDQHIWKEKTDAQNKAMLLLMHLKNNNAKKDLRLAYSQGNKSTYPVNVVSMARYLLSQINQVGFLDRQTSIIRTGCLKAIIIPFDTGWNFIQYMINKIICLMLLLLSNFGSIARNTITSMHVLVNSACNTT